MNSKACAQCGKEMELVHEKDEFAIGSRRTTVDVERYRCESCDEVFYTPDQALQAQRAAATQMRAQEGLLAPEEIKQIRTQWSLSQSILERLLGVGPKTVVRWERGTVFQNSATDQLLRIIRDVPEAFAYLAEQRGLVIEPVVHPEVVDIGEWQRSPSTTFKVKIKPLPLTDIPRKALR